MKAIITRNVSYSYPDGTLGISDTTIDIEKGERVALVGANGSGKSTMLLLFSGLVKPKTGSVEILGKSINKKNSKFFRQNVGILFQNPDDFLFNPTVRDELLYTPAQLEIDESEAIKMAERYAELFGIERFLDRPPFRLSGGEKKKVALACVLMMEPSILLLDEPTANIDGKTRRNIVEMVSSTDSTLVIATHELDFIDRLSDRVVIMGMNKEIMADGGLDLLEDNDLLERAGII